MWAAVAVLAGCLVWCSVLFTRATARARDLAELLEESERVRHDHAASLALCVVALRSEVDAIATSLDHGADGGYAAARLRAAVRQASRRPA
jgi:hypothetical protein